MKVSNNFFIYKYGLYFTWLIATLGMIASLYFSEVRHLEPCHLCWYQRIALFPLCFILGIAAYRGFLGIALYVMPQTIVGFLLALYQVIIQEFRGWNPIDMCGAGPSCSEKISIGLGPITIPMLSALGFLVISILLTLLWLSYRKEKNSQDRQIVLL